MKYELQKRIRAVVGQPEAQWNTIEESRSKPKLNRELNRLRKEAIGTGFYQAYAGCPEFRIVGHHHKNCIRLRGAAECNCRELYAAAKKYRAESLRIVRGPKVALKKMGVGQWTTK